MIETLAIVVPTAFMLSFGHCLGMCGGFVIAYNVKLAKFDKKTAFFYSLVYQISRVLTYCLLGAIAGFFGSFFHVSARFQGFFYFVIGVIFVILGLALIFRGKLLALVENDRIWQKIFKKPIQNALNSDKISNFAILGFFNGLIPCGVIYTFLVHAIRSQSALNGAVIMLVFGICTLPALLGFSAVTNLLNLKFKKAMLIVSSLIIIIFGIYNAYLGFLATYE